MSQHELIIVAVGNEKFKFKLIMSSIVETFVIIGLNSSMSDLWSTSTVDQRSTSICKLKSGSVVKGVRGPCCPYSTFLESKKSFFKNV